MTATVSTSVVCEKGMLVDHHGRWGPVYCVLFSLRLSQSCAGAWESGMVQKGWRLLSCNQNYVTYEPCDLGLWFLSLSFLACKILIPCVMR